MKNNPICINCDHWQPLSVMSSCDWCHEWICDDCSVDIDSDGARVCKECYDEGDFKQHEVKDSDNAEATN